MPAPAASPATTYDVTAIAVARSPRCCRSSESACFCASHVHGRGHSCSREISSAATSYVNPIATASATIAPPPSASSSLYERRGVGGRSRASSTRGSSRGGSTTLGVVSGGGSPAGGGGSAGFSVAAHASTCARYLRTFASFGGCAAAARNARYAVTALPHCLSNPYACAASNRYTGSGSAVYAASNVAAARP